MGHSSIRVTADTYGHLIPSANVNAVDRLDAQTTVQESATPAQPTPMCRSRNSLQVAEKIGGPGRDRTDDLMTASHARSQLRHRPTMRMPRGLETFVARDGWGVNGGFQLAVSGW